MLEQAKRIGTTGVVGRAALAGAVVAAGLL